MRIIDDLKVCESAPEFGAALASVPIPAPCKKANSKSKYTLLNCTMTFDTETTNTHEDGFIYSYQLCICGVCAVSRTYRGFVAMLQEIAQWANLSATRRIVCHVHNLGYEMHYLAQLLALDFGIEKALLTSTHKYLTLDLSEHFCFRDSLRLFQKSLARATVNCKHPKAAGDLDYSVYRDEYTPLSDDEYRYIVYDVIGLYEAIEGMKKECHYTAQSLPLTNTGRVINSVVESIRAQGRAGQFQTIKKTLALNKQQLELATLCMGGGDTHGTRWRAARTYHKCNSIDFKSAHPSQMLTGLYPSGELVDMGAIEESDGRDLIAGRFGFFGRACIINPHCKRDKINPVLSVSKCEYIQGELLTDNGRLISAVAVVCYMDSNDYLRFADAYEYTDLSWRDVTAFQLNPLPDYFRGVIKDWFYKKEVLPKDDPERDYAKICVNTIYGACAQKPVREDIEMLINADGEREIASKSWRDVLADMTEQDVIAAQLTPRRLPFLWGMWTSSLTRLRLYQLQTLIEDATRTPDGVGGVLYWDTDSVKYGGEKPACIDAYNSIQIERVLLSKAEIYVDGAPVYIGIAEDEHPNARYGYTDFRFLHAKCYAYRESPDTPLQVTIAGVNKKCGQAAFCDNIENLRDGFLIKPAGGQKLWYYDRAPVRFDTDNPAAGYIYMEDREYIINDLEHAATICEENYLC